MKKVGIVTLHRPNNYGANLQAYALQEFVNKLGYEGKIIDYINPKLENSNKIITFNNGIVQLLKSIIFSIKNLKRKNNFEKFRKNNYSLSELHDIDQIERNNNKFDVYLSGSDQIWNEKITKGIDDVYTLNFNTGAAKKISYASSMGNSDLGEEKTKEIANRIKKYDTIAVREEKAKETLKRYIDKDIQVVVDPTLLLTKDDWSKIADEKIASCIKEEYILFYTIIENEEIFKIVNTLSMLTGLKIVTLRRTNMKTKNVLKNFYTKGPECYIQLFKNAKYIVTSSFHGTVFSIIFNKPFFVNYAGTENKRVDNILKICDLQDRKLDYAIDLDIEKVNKLIDYEEVNKAIETERNKSKEYLIKAIEGVKYE